MANTTTLGTNSLTITGLDADWLYSTSTDCPFPGGIVITAITFIPSAINDRMIVRDGGVDAADIFDSGIVAGTDAVRFTYDTPRKRFPVIDISDCTFGTAANAKVFIEWK